MSTETKFTPGPWHDGGEHGWSSAVFDANGLPIAFCSVPGQGSRKANARLIAAAPELYEALDTLSLVVGLTAFKHEGQRAPLQEAVDAARAALAKARGE